MLCCIKLNVELLLADFISTSCGKMLNNVGDDSLHVSISYRLMHGACTYFSQVFPSRPQWVTMPISVTMPICLLVSCESSGSKNSHSELTFTFSLQCNVVSA